MIKKVKRTMLNYLLRDSKVKEETIESLLEDNVLKEKTFSRLLADRKVIYDFYPNRGETINIPDNVVFYQSRIDGCQINAKEIKCGAFCSLNNIIYKK